MHNDKWTASPALGRKGGCEIGVVGGAMEVGLRFAAREKGASRGEGDLAPTRYEWGRAGGNWEGSGTMSYGRICLKCDGELQFYPCL